MLLSMATLPTMFRFVAPGATFELYSSRLPPWFPGSTKTPRATRLPGELVRLEQIWKANRLRKSNQDYWNTAMSEPAQVGGDDADALAQAEGLDHLFGGRNGHAPP